MDPRTPKGLPDPVRPTRRAVLAALAVGCAGCLFNARTGLRASPALWPTFRFVHLTGLGLSFGGDVAAHRRALAAAAAVRALPELDFVLLGGDLVAGTDPRDASLLEEFVDALGLPWYAVPGPGESPAEGQAASLGGRAWKTPWSHAPLRGVRLVGLSAGGAGGEPLGEIPFLTDVVDRHPLDAVLVVLARPVRMPDAVRALGAAPLDAEMLRFVLEAAPNVKMVLTGAPAPYVAEAAGCLHVGTPALSAFPRLFREITIAGQGAVVRNRRLPVPGEEGTGAPGAPPDARRRLLEGETGRRVWALR